MGYETGQAGARDPIERESSKPLFQALIYPGGSSLIVPNSDSPPAGGSVTGPTSLSGHGRDLSWNDPAGG